MGNIRMDIGSVLAVLLAILPFAGGAATYYVKPDGSDSNNGKSWDTAFATPNKGFSKIHKNDIADKLIIRTGHYLLSEACALQAQACGDEVCSETGNPADVILDG